MVPPPRTPAPLVLSTRGSLVIGTRENQAAQSRSGSLVSGPGSTSRLDQVPVRQVSLTSRSLRRFAWRLTYAVVETRVAVAVAAAVVGLVTRFFGELRAQGALSAFERRFVLSGRSGRAFGAVNLHRSRFLARVRRSHRVARPVSAKRVGSGR